MTASCIKRNSSVECLQPVDQHPHPNVDFTKPALHLLLPGMLCFDRVQPVASLESFCTSHWTVRWPKTGENTADEGRREDVSASGATARRGAGSVLLQGKALRLPALHNLTHPTATLSFFHQLSVQVSQLFCFTNLSMMFLLPCHMLLSFSLLFL